MYIFILSAPIMYICGFNFTRKVVQAVDSIIIKGLEFMACHGFYRKKRNPSLHRCPALPDLRAAAASDDWPGVDYSRVYQSIEAVVQGSPFNLIETYREHRPAYSERIPGGSGSYHAKPQAPMPGRFHAGYTYLRAP